MPAVYVIKDDGEAIPMEQVHCKDEAAELQALLEANHDLLPGDQIHPEDPCRWLLVKREMPVQHPGSGQPWWSIDFLFVDQRGIPTFVECKRFTDRSSRREVVGQMLEYAANGHYYWDRELIRRLAEESATSKGMSLEEAVKTLEPEGGATPEELLDLVESNLREGQVRLVFFLEEAPQELKSIVDFLNRQMQRTEVLIVEARRYEREGVRVIVPSLFGYTEQARIVKKDVGRRPVRRRWTEEDFFAQARGELAESALTAVRHIYDWARTHGCTIRWGTGARTGSFSVGFPELRSSSVLTVYTTGGLSLNFGSLGRSDLDERIRDRLGRLAGEDLGFPLPEVWQRRYPNFRADAWVPRAQELVAVLTALRDEARGGSSEAGAATDGPGEAA